jgi:hypothetical protein
MPLETITPNNQLLPTNYTLGAGPGVSSVWIPLVLASMTTGAADLMTSWIPGHTGKILKMEFVTTTLGTGSGASQILNLEIGATDLTGGVLTLLLADTTPLGKVKAATAITALNEFTATDAISLEVAASGTVFTAGSGAIILQIQNTQG